MSIAALCAVWEDSKAKGDDLLVLLAIANNAGGSEDAGEIMDLENGLELAAKRARITLREVKDSVRRLIDTNEIELITDDRPRPHAIYRITRCPLPDGEVLV